MNFELTLWNEPFEKIKSKKKTIEMRLNDENKSKIKENDTIHFTNVVTNEQISVNVLKIYHFNNFEELYMYFPKSKLGYNEDDIASPDDMLQYYSKEKIEKYGVLGIEISVF